MNTLSKYPLFELGSTFCTPAILEKISTESIIRLLYRHQHGDWGNLEEEDIKTNEETVINGQRILSSYMVGTTPVWVITEWDRSATTLLLPEEY